MHSKAARATCLATLIALTGCDNGDATDPEATTAEATPQSEAQERVTAPAGAPEHDCTAQPGCAPEVVGLVAADIHVGEVRGDRLYGFGGGGFYVIDVADPTAPTILGHADAQISGIPIGLATSEALAFVLTMSGIAVIDVSDPATPTQVATLATRATDVEVVGTTALLVGDFQPLMRIWDFSDPASASEIGQVAAARWEGSTGASRLARSGNTLVVSDGFGLVLFDVSDPRTPTELAQTRHSNTFEAELSGQHAFVANTISGFDVVDLSDPGAPAVVLNGCEGASTMYLGVTDSTVFLDHDNRGDRAVLIFDVGNPAEPRMVGRLDSVWPHASLGAANSAYFVTRETGQPMVNEVVALRGCSE